MNFKIVFIITCTFTTHNHNYIEFYVLNMFSINHIKVKISENFFQLFLMESCKDTCSNN